MNQPYKLISPEHFKEQPWICAGCWGEKSFDIAWLENVGCLGYVERIDHYDDTRSAIVLLDCGSQGHHCGILAAFARKPLPEPNDPTALDDYIEGSNPDAEAIYDKWEKYFEPRAFCKESGTSYVDHPYLSPVDKEETPGHLWNWIYDSHTWWRFYGHAVTSVEIINALMTHHGMPQKYYSLERWLFGYCGKILIEYESTFGPIDCRLK